MVHLGLCTSVGKIAVEEFQGGGGANRILYRNVLLYGVRKHTQSRGVWRHSPGKFLNNDLQPLRLFLMSSETTCTVWFVSAMANVYTNFMILY